MEAIELHPPRTSEPIIGIHKTGGTNPDVEDVPYIFREGSEACLPDELVNGGPGASLRTKRVIRKNPLAEVLIIIGILAPRFVLNHRRKRFTH